MNTLLEPSNRLQRRLRSWLSPEFPGDRTLFDVESSLFPSPASINTPCVNIRETPDEFILELAAPGLNRSDFNIEVENYGLTISADRGVRQEKENSYTRKEYSYDSFSRCFALPENIKEGAIEAKYDNGILTVTVPKATETTTKQVHSIPVE